MSSLVTRELAREWGSWSSVPVTGTADQVRPILLDVSPPPGPELPKGVRVTIGSLSGILCTLGIFDNIDTYAFDRFAIVT